MTYRETTRFLLIFTLVFLFATSIHAQSLINYQGRLTDTAGDPVPDNFYQLTFTLYDGTGGQLWTSGLQTVQVKTGLFSHILGSSNPIPDSVFESSTLYLGIKVGEDPEIDPRTLLTSTPHAIVANKLSGKDIETGDGYLKVTTADETEEISIGSETRGAIGINFKTTEPLDRDLLTLTADPDGENRIDLFYPDAEAEAGIVQIAANPDVGGYISIHMAEPLLAEGGRFGVAAPDTGFIRLFGGGHGSEYPLVEMTAQSEEGGKLNILTEIGKYMGIEPSPMHDGGRLSLFNTDPTDGRELMTLKSEPSEGTSLVGFNPQPEPPGIPAFELGVNPAGRGPGSYFRLNSHLTEYLGDPSFEVSNSSAGGLDMLFFNPQPDPPGRQAMALSVDVGGGGSIKMFQPQPEPPGKVAIEMGMNTSVKGNGGGRLSVYDADSISTELTGGVLQIHHPTDVTLPSLSSRVESELVSMNLMGKKDATGGGGAIISMVAREDSAKVGIGTDDPAEALHVVGNITCTGEMYIFTTTKLKTNIRPINNAVEKIMNLKGVHYNYKYDEFPKLKLAETDQVGLLAEDVEKVLPEIVHEDQDGNKMVAYIKLTAVLVEAVKEQQEMIDQLRNRIETLEVK